MVELLSEGKIHPEWQPFVEEAGEYLAEFNPQGTKPYTCTSPHFHSKASDSTIPTSYSTDYNELNFGESVIVVDEEYGGILMGLDPTSANGVLDLRSVQLLFDVPDTRTGTLDKIFKILTKLGILAIDTDRQGNGYWIIPKVEKGEATEEITSTSLDIATRLSYKITGVGSESANEIIQALKEDFGIRLPNPVTKWTPSDFAIIFTDITTLAVGKSPKHVSTVTVKLPSFNGFVLYISQTSNDTAVQTTVALKEDVSGSISQDSDPKQLLGKLSSFTDAPLADDAIPGDLFTTIRLWYADINFSTKDWTIALILDLPIGSGPEGKFPIYLKYDKKTKTFEGGILRGTLPEDSEKLLPGYKEYHDLPQDIVEANDAQPYIDLGRVFGFKPPKGLPTNLTAGSIVYTQKDTEEGKPSILTIEVELGTGSNSEPEDPPAPFNWESAAFKYKKDAAVSWHVTSVFTLKEKTPTILPDGTTRPDGVLLLDLGRDDGKWSLTGIAEKVNFAMLGGFFDPNLSDAMVSILGKIEIAELIVDYSYDPTGKASDFLFSGTINIGKLQLSLFYQYASSSGSPEERKKKLEKRGGAGPPPPKAVTVPSGQETAWELDAFLSASGPDETIGSIIESIIGDNPLPEFISNVDVPTKDVETGGKPLISIKVAKIQKDKVVFVFNVAIGIVEFSFIQIAGKKGTPTRILRLSIGPLPFIQDIPVIKELPQPYQLLTYCFVGGVEVKKEDIDLLNKEYIKDSQIYYKREVQNQKTGLRPGHHFIVVNNDECILDHTFTEKPTQGPRNNDRGLLAAKDSSNEPAQSESAPTKGALKKQTNFLSITGISVQYKKKTLWLFIDASLVLGPVEMNLIGFGIGLKLSNPNLKINDLSTFNLKDDLDWQLNGLAMGFNQPPVLIAGVFIHEKTDTIDSYRGGIAVGIQPYQFVAVGEYAEVQNGSESYKSIFIYAKLDGPLVDLAIAVIKGVRLGFGYNSFVRTPTIEELADFPFINDTGIGGAGNSPMAILEAMRGGSNPWVQVKQDSFWFAIGFTVAAFDIITATAVALLEFSDDGVVVNIFADVIGQMPPEVKEREMCILYVELLVNAELNFIHDYFFVQAALAPTSFLLVPQCALFGGFAMGTWFGRSDYAGDWVFTVGGYHRRFNVPDHYPRPERLGIKFSIGDNMTIRGEGYFAITPKAVMGGAMIYVQISVGPVSAHLTAGFDALLEFQPLHYIVDVYVDVGVSCRVHLLFVSFDISIDIGADLHIEGPNFGGVAHVDFWFFSFDVYFGDQPSPPPPLTLAQFYDVVAKAGPPEETSPTKADDVEKEFVVQLKLSLEEGAAPKPLKDAEPGAGPENTGSGAKWRVRGGNFRFRVSSVFAITSASLATNESMALKHDDPTAAKELEQKVANVSSIVPVSSIPMKVGPGGIDSALDITITKEDADGEERYPSGWQPEFVVKPVPTALWGNPAHPPDALDSKDGTVPQQMSVSISAPLPVLAVSKIPPVNATEINRQLVLERKLAPSETQSKSLPATLEQTPKNWPDMQTTWETMAKGNVDVAKSLVTGCMKTLAWDMPAPEVLQKTKDVVPKPWELAVNFPTRLVTGSGGLVEGVEDGLANTYLALPRVVAV